MVLDYKKYLNKTVPKKTTSAQDIVNSVLKKSTVTTVPSKQVNPPSKSPFNPNTPGHDEFVKQTDQRAPSTSTFKNFVSSIPGALKTVGKFASDLPVGLVKGTYNQYAHPSEGSQQVEKAGGVNKLPPVAKQIAQGLIRTGVPGIEGLAKDIGQGNFRNFAKLSAEQKVNTVINTANAGLTFLSTAAPVLKGKSSVPYQEKTSFVKSNEPILFKDSTIAPRIANEIKASVTQEIAPRSAVKPKVVSEPLNTPGEALKAGQEVSYPKTTKGGKPLNPTTYKPLEQPQIQTPEIKTSKLAQGVEEKAIAKKLADGFEGLPEYAKVNVADQSKAATNLIKTNREQAIRIAMGHEKPPEGVLPESVFVAVENHAIQTKNVALLKDLATSSSLTSEATGMGQRIRMLAERDPNSAVSAMKKVIKLREEAAAKKYGPQAKTKIASEIAGEIKKTVPKAKDWSSFLDEIRCK